MTAIAQRNSSLKCCGMGEEMLEGPYHLLGMGESLATVDYAAPPVRSRGTNSRNPHNITLIFQEEYKRIKVTMDVAVFAALDFIAEQKGLPLSDVMFYVKRQNLMRLPLPDAAARYALRFLYYRAHRPLDNEPLQDPLGIAPIRLRIRNHRLPKKLFEAYCAAINLDPAIAAWAYGIRYHKPSKGQSDHAN